MHGVILSTQLSPSEKVPCVYFSTSSTQEFHKAPVAGSSQAGGVSLVVGDGFEQELSRPCFDVTCLYVNSRGFLC